MPRSNSSSCAHEQHQQDQEKNCDCHAKTSFFKRKVVSEHVRAEWHTVALSMILLFLHMVLIFKIAGISLSNCLVSLNEANATVPVVATTTHEVVAEQTAQNEPIPTALRAPDYGGSGTLAALSSTGDALGQCILKNTVVIANVNSGLAHVSVTQKFHNPFKKKIQAVYAFPLDEHCAVESMQLHCGDRVIRGEIKQRGEAKDLYQSAVEAGQTAALLEEERPNIFTQSVANINPGEDVSVSLNYVSVLPFENGDYTFTFPTTIGPRFIPGNPIGVRGAGTQYDTNVVPDASRITPPAPRLQSRSGRDITLKVFLDSPFPVTNIVSKLHKVTAKYNSGHTPVVLLNRDPKIPNADFVLSWHTAKDSVQAGVQTHGEKGDGYLSLTLMPPDHFDQAASCSKEFIFLVDCSGSQDGPPLEKAKETLSYIAEHMAPQDTLQILSFNESVGRLYDHAKPMSIVDKMNAMAFIRTLRAEGGTFMANAVEEACSIPIDPKRLRIVTFMTDGFVGDDREIIGLVKKYRGTSRWFSFGTGNNVNRHLIDGIARAGGGEAEYVLLDSPSKEIAESFWKKVSSPVLTNVQVDFGGLAVHDVVPDVPSDVWSQRPLTFSARYSKPGRGTVTVTGFAGGKEYKQKIQVFLPSSRHGNDVIDTLWARRKVELLCDEDNLEIATGYRHKNEYQITKLGLEHHLLTPYTSFVAIDRHLSSGKSKRVARHWKSEKDADALAEYFESDVVPVDPRYGQNHEVVLNTTYMGIKRFWGDDIIGNTFQNIGQLIGKWISEWINGVFADTVRCLMHATELLILNPFIVLRGLCHQVLSFMSQPEFFYVRSAVDLLYGSAGGAVMFAAVLSAVSPRNSGSERTSAVVRCGLIAVTILAMPWIYRVCFQLSDVFIAQAYPIDFSLYPMDAAMASAIKGGLMAGAGLLAHAFAPIVGGAAGGLALGLVGEVVAFCGLFFYLIIALIATCQLAYLLVMIGCQSLLFALQVILGPIFIACGANSKTEKIASGYFASWAEMAVWFASNVLLLSALRLILFSDFNPWGKIVMALVIFQAMIFAPRAFSILNISPLSKYLAMNPVFGVARGVSQLAKTAIEIYSSFKPPR